MKPAVIEATVHDYFGWKCGGDGDNGETLMYELDILFEEREVNRG
jgi:hypothetical protein